MATECFAPQTLLKNTLCTNIGNTTITLQV